MDQSFVKWLSEFFKEYPVYLALLFIIYLQFKSGQAKDTAMNELAKIQLASSERLAKLNALLEILISRGSRE